LRAHSAVLARAGALLAVLREWDAAAKIIPEFVKLHSAEPDAWRALARARFESNDIAGGCEASLHVLQLDPKCALSHHNLALAALRSGDLSGASSWVRKGLALTRTDEGLRRLRSRVLLTRVRSAAKVCTKMFRRG
jgi:tetratricopeptide (TPR) repeat protein